MAGDYPAQQYGNWRGVYGRLRMWAIGGTRERVFTWLMAQADAEDDLYWAVSVDSTIVRAPQHVAGGPQDRASASVNVPSAPERRHRCRPRSRRRACRGRSGACRPRQRRSFRRRPPAPPGPGGGVDAAVQHGDLHTAAVVPRLPRGRVPVRGTLVSRPARTRTSSHTRATPDSERAPRSGLVSTCQSAGASPQPVVSASALSRGKRCSTSVPSTACSCSGPPGSRRGSRR